MNPSPVRAVFLDRDGVLNEARIVNGNPFPPARLEDLRITDGAPESMSLLRDAGFLLIGVTNQPDVARGTQRREVVEAINREIQSKLSLVDILTCYHDDGDNCDCRKPRPGLLTVAAERFGIHLPGSFLIGDRWKDIEAGRRAGCATVLIGSGYSELVGHTRPDRHEASLADAVRWILDGPTKKATGGGINGSVVES